MRDMGSNQIRIIELLREVHLIALKEIEWLNLRIAELVPRSLAIEKPLGKLQVVEPAPDNRPPTRTEPIIMNEKQFAACVGKTGFPAYARGI
jgi:hypothetical protein